MSVPMRALRRTGVFLCGVATVLLAAPGTSAAPVFQPAATVVLFTPSASDALVARLEAELTAIGIQVRKVSTPSEGQLDAAVARELATGASAAIRVMPRSRGAEVWSGDTTVGTRRWQATGSGTSDLAVIALQTVEFLRATLLETEERNPGPAATDTLPSPAPSAGSATGTAASPEPPPRGTTSPGGAQPPLAAEERPAARSADPAAAQPSRPAPRQPPRLPEWGLEAPAELSAREPLRLELFAGPALLASPGGVSPITSIAVMGRTRLSEQAGIELMGVVPVVPARLAHPEGTVAIKTVLLGAAVVFGLPAPRRLHADVAFGASAIMLRAAGSASGSVGSGPTPNVGSVQTGWKAAGHARVGAGIDLNRWLSARIDLLGGLTGRTTIGYDVTDVAGQTVTTDRASWGPAFAVATAGLQASW